MMNIIDFSIEHHCARCGRVLTALEAMIDDRWLCHPDDPALPDCYTLASHEMGEPLSRWMDITAAFTAVPDNDEGPSVVA